MMRFRILLLAVTFAGASGRVQAQTGSADGVAAFVRGDYQRTVEILKPLAERWPMPGDPTAQFLMAVLYENGLGVPRDPIRACTLYMLQRPDGPFGQEAAMLFKARWDSSSQEERQRCMVLSVLGFHHGFEPITFMLGGGHSIAFDLGEQNVVATITYDGRERRVDVPHHRHGPMFLPIEHTELSAGRTPRHFIELLTWVPTKPQRWSFMWQLFEVVRDALVPVTSAELATVVAERPPAKPPHDLRSMAQVRLTDSGDAEWVALIDGEMRSALVESEDQRREAGEAAEQQRRRSAAEAAVDWSRARDVNRAPALTYADSDGCGHVFAYGWSPDRSEAISIRADRDALGLSTTPQTFDITQHPGRIDLAVHVFERPQRSWEFCSHVRILPGPTQEKWTATSGMVTIELSPPGIRVRSPHLYRATIHIVGAEFVNGSGVRVKQTQPLTLTAVVGGNAG